MIQPLYGVESLLDTLADKGYQNAKRICAARVARTGDPKHRFDALTVSQQSALASASLLAVQLEGIFPKAARADAETWRNDLFAGKETSLHKVLAARADSASGAGGGVGSHEGIYVLPQIFEELVAPYGQQDFVPVNSSLNPGIQTVQHRRRYHTGQHLPVSAGGGTMGRVAGGINSRSTNLHWYGSFAEFYMMEALEADYAGQNLQEFANMGLRQVVAAKQDDILWNGDSATGLDGIIGYDNVEVVIGTALDVTDPDGVVSEILDQMGSIRRLSNGAMDPNVVVLAERIYTALSKPRSGVMGNGLDALQSAIRARGGGDVKIRGNFRLNATGPSSEDGVLYLDDRHGINGLQQLAIGPMVIPVVNGIKTELYYVTKQGGVAMPMAHAARISWHSIS